MAVRETVLFRVALFAILALQAASCHSDREPPEYVRVTTGPVVATVPQAPAVGEMLRFVCANVLSPERSSTSYDRFARYLGARLGRPVEIVRRRTYAELNELLRTGNAQAGVVCTGAYAVGREEFGLRLVVVPAMDGRPTYRSYLVVRKASGRHDLDELKGATFAFSDPLSNSGYRHMAAALHARGTTPESYFGRTFFTYSHDNTIRAVRDGIADGGSVDSLIWDQTLRETPGLEQEVEVVDRSPEYPNNPVVASPRMPPEAARRLREVLLGMASDPAAQEALAAMGASSFVAGSDADYDPIVRSWRDLGRLPPPSARAR